MRSPVPNVSLHGMSGPVSDKLVKNDSLSLSLGRTLKRKIKEQPRAGTVPGSGPGPLFLFPNNSEQLIRNRLRTSATVFP